MNTPDEQRMHNAMMMNQAMAIEEAALRRLEAAYQEMGKAIAELRLRRTAQVEQRPR